jgi:TolA-binding protein
MKRFPKYQMHLPTLIIAMTTTLGVPHTYATPMSNSISFAVQYSNSSTDTDKILAEARNQIEKSRKEITKQRLVISKQQNTIAKEREQIGKEIEKLHREIERYKNKIAKARAKIDEARALIQVEQDLIAQARDTINSILDSDNDGVTNINDLCLDTPSGTEVDENGCPIPESDWALVWSDEFDGVEIDSSKWTHEVNCSGGGNQY